jgi:hypothetical protein
MTLPMNRIYCRQQIVWSSFLIYSSNLHVLIGELRPFTFRVIIEKHAPICPFFLFFYFLQYWGLNSWPSHGATPPALFLWRVFQDSIRYCNPLDLCLLSSYDYRHDPLVPNSLLLLLGLLVYWVNNVLLFPTSQLFISSSSEICSFPSFHAYAYLYSPSICSISLIIFFTAGLVEFYLCAWVTSSCLHLCDARSEIRRV